MSIHSTQSTSREKLIEHLFIGELLKHAWRSNGEISFEISKPEVDNKGYDIIIEKGRAIRHIQLKTRKIGSKANRYNVHIALTHKTAGCIVVIEFNEDTLELGYFYFYGRGINESMIPSTVISKHTRANAEGTKQERPDIRVYKLKQFERINTLEELLTKLFN